MAYWNCIFSKKGPMGTIWVASHCFKRVKKDQVAQINVVSSVDKILLDEAPVFTYRILGYLLLGVVRIYSKKAEYLYDDCHQMLVKVNDFIGSKKGNVDIEAICTPSKYFCVTRPESFELDAFDLQILEDERGANVRSAEDITLADKWQNDGSGHFLFQEYFSDKGATDLEALSVAYATIEDVLSSYANGDGMASPPHKLSNAGASIEKLRQNIFLLEDRLDPIPFCEIEEELGLFRPFDAKYQHEEVQSKFPENKNDFVNEKESTDPIRLLHEEVEEHMKGENIKLQETMSPEKRKSQKTAEERALSVTVDVTPKSNCLYSSGAITPEFLVVPTPAAKEPARVLKKRKCLFDEIIVLPNRVLKESIVNPSDLVCKRKKALHTALDTWKEYQISHLPQTLLEPLISGVSLELGSLFSKKILKRLEAVKAVQDPEKLDVLTCPPVQKSKDEEDIAPSTPVAKSSSLSLNELWKIKNSGEVGPTGYPESLDEGYEDEELDTDPVNEMDSSEQDNWDELSMGTRTLARYLCWSFQHQKAQREPVNFLPMLECKTRSESARLFYEILVLQTGGYIEVQQHAPYADIVVQETSKLRQSCQVDEAS